MEVDDTTTGPHITLLDRQRVETSHGPLCDDVVRGYHGNAILSIGIGPHPGRHTFSKPWGREKEKISEEEAAVGNDIDKTFGSRSQAVVSHVNDKASSSRSHAEAIAFDIDKPSNSRSHAEAITFDIDKPSSRKSHEEAIAFDNDKARRRRQETEDIEATIREAEQFLSSSELTIVQAGKCCHVVKILSVDF